MKWTPKQDDAIHAKPCTLLVSAAAGSGKTSVLTERIVQKIADKKSGLTVENLVVVTFTKAAAGELKDRLHKRLSEAAAGGHSRHLNSQLNALSSARISTVHSFCYSLVRENAHRLGLSSAVRIADEPQNDSMLREAAKKIIRAYYAGEDWISTHDAGDFYLLLELCGVRGDDAPLMDLLIDLYKNLRTYPSPMTLLPESIARLSEQLEACRAGGMSVYDCDFFPPLARRIQNDLAGVAKQFIKLREAAQAFPQTKESTLEIIEAELQDVLICRDCDPRELRKNLQSALIAKGKIGAQTGYADSEEWQKIKKLRQEAKDEVKKAAARLIQCDEETICTDLKKTLSLIRVTDALIQDLDREYSAIKKEAALLDYGDLEQFCAQLLCRNIRRGENGVEFERTELAEKLSEEIRELYVDEYQDTNLLQDMIFRAASRPGRMFLVGDPKQSVYGFRGAKPEIFARYKNSFADYREDRDDTEQRLMLSNNFRCDRNVIDFTNRVFSLLMNTDKENPLYTEADELIFTKDSDSGLKVEFLLTDKGKNPSEKDEEESAFEEDAEANRIAQRIAALLREGILTEKKAPLKYEDVAVLARSSDTLAKIRSALTQAGIPCTENADESFFSSSEILFLTSLLQIIDNPHNDVALAAVLNSPVFAFSPDQLLAIRGENRDSPYYAAAQAYSREDETAEKLRQFFDVMENLRDYARRNSVCDLLLHCLELTDAENIFAAYLPAQRVRGNIRTLLDLAADCDNCSDAGPALLLERLEFQARKKTKNAEDSAGNEVRLMTIHHSKGLEFPCVIVAGLGKGFNNSDSKKICAFDPALGLAYKLFDESGMAKIRTAFFESVILKKKREQLEEEKRLLYVALTRARQKLILSGSADAAAIFKKLYPGDAPDGENAERLAESADSLLNLITAALCGDALLFGTLKGFLEGESSCLCGEDDCFSVSVAAKSHIRPPEEAPRNHTKKQAASGFPDPEFDEKELCALLDFEYAFSTLSQIPKKVSVSSLAPITDTENQAPVPMALEDIFSQTRKGGAFAGTATHRFMQFCDFAACERDIPAEARRLLDQGFISPEQFEVLRFDRLRAFFESPLYQSVKTSAQVHRELRFNVFLPASQLIEDGPDKDVLVQGVIDCFFENPDGTYTLLDFKTDSVRGSDARSILTQRHARQLEIYRPAVEKMTGRSVSRVLLWSFALGEAVECRDPVPAGDSVPCSPARDSVPRP